jgi:CheY-like chemotaxis protein
VLEAGDGAAALAILQSPSQLDLLITDVGLPGGINGHQVADAARSLRAGLKVLLVSGYAENAAIGRAGGLAAGMQILSKPFSIDTLARRIVDLMDNEPP